MEPQPAFGFKELFTHLVGNVAKAVSERDGETREQQLNRSRAAVHTIMGMRPRDAIEVMLFGQCLMIHEVLIDTVHRTLHGESDIHRRATRSGIVAMAKAFGNHLVQLERYQARPAEGRRDMPEQRAVDAQDEPRQPPPPLTEAARGQPVPPAIAPIAVAQPAESPVVGIYRPSPEAIAVCRANPAAMAALEAGDPAAFARALGVNQPSDAYVAAATGQMPIDQINAADRRHSGTGLAHTHPQAFRSGGGVADIGQKQSL